LAHFEPEAIRAARTGVLKQQYLQHFALLAVVDQRIQAVVGLLGDKVAGVCALFEENLDYRVQRWFHDPLEAQEHVVERNQSNPRDC